MSEAVFAKHIKPFAARALAEAAAQPLRAFCYSRASHDPRQRRTSTRDQSIENRRTCADKGWEVAGEFEDTDRSASRHAKKDRKDWAAMVARLQAGECDVLVFWDSSRGYRDLEVYVQLRKLCLEHHVLLCYNGEIFDMSKRSDRKRSAQDAIENEDEAEKIRERVLRTKRLSAERGAPVGHAPYGYRREYDPKTGDLIGQVPDQAQAPVVREAMARVLSADPLKMICDDFNERGIPAPGPAQRWQSPSLRKILLNPAIIGVRVHQKRQFGKAAWKAIVDEADFNACRRLLTDPQRRTQRGTAGIYLLSGLAKCFCGADLRPATQAGRTSYICKTCFGAAMVVTKLDLYVEAAVLGRLEQPEFLRALHDGSRSEQMREALRVVDELEAQLAEARALVGTRELTVASLAAVEKQLLPQIEAARKIASDASHTSVAKQIAGPDARRLWPALSLPQRRAVLREVVRVTLNRARARGARTIEAGRVVLEWQV